MTSLLSIQVPQILFSDVSPKLISHLIEKSALIDIGKRRPSKKGANTRRMATMHDVFSYPATCLIAQISVLCPKFPKELH